MLLLNFKPVYIVCYMFYIHLTAKNVLVIRLFKFLNGLKNKVLSYRIQIELEFKNSKLSCLKPVGLAFFDSVRLSKRL